MAKRGTLKKSAPRDVEQRPIRWRRYPHLFLIVCEDGNTEPSYFGTFQKDIPANTIYLRTVGTGRSSKGVVEQAIVERQKLADEANKSVDEVWAVFDKDDAEKVPANAARFAEAFAIAKREKIDVAYSNEVFELWLLLHLADVNAAHPMPRSTIYASLEAAIQSQASYRSFLYEHGKLEVLHAVGVLGNEAQAVVRAERLLLSQKGKAPIDANPSTTVHVLVKRLRDFIAWYGYDPNEA